MKRIILAALLFAGLLSPSHAQFNGCQAGFCAPATAAAAGLALDGNAVDSSASASSLAPVLSTTGTNRVILVLITSQNATVSSVTSAHLTFTQRAAANRFGVQFSYVYWAIASSALTSETITVTFSGAASVIANAIGISGANTASPFDPNGALPGLVGTGGPGGAYASITTSNANTFLYCVSFFDSTSTPTQGAGWTLLQAPATRQSLSEYKIVSATQSGVQCTSGNGAAADVDAAVGDAVTQ